MQVTVTRTVTDASVAVIHRDVFNSNYARVDGLTLIGRAASTPSSTPTPSPSTTPVPPAPSAAP